MGEPFEGWTSWVEDAYLLSFSWVEDHECFKYHYMTKTKKDEPRFTVDEEIEEMNKQINESEGFDIDYSKFRNYHLVDPDDHDFLKEPETDGDLMKMLSQESLKRYNQKCVKANS